MTTRSTSTIVDPREGRPQVSDQPQGPNWWQASDGRWYPPEQHPSVRSQAPPPFAPQYQGAPPQQAGQYVPTPAPPQKSGFAQGLGVGTGCLLAGVIGIVLLLGGCGVLIAIGSMAGNDSASSGGSSASTGSTSQEEMDTDLVDFSAEPPDSLGLVYVTVTVKNTSSKRSDYRVDVSLESPDCVGEGLAD